MAILNNRSPFYDKRADILTTGRGGKDFSDSQIKNYFAAGVTPERAMNDMLANNVSMDRVAQAMGPSYNVDKLTSFAKKRGVSFDEKDAGFVDVPGTFKDRRASILTGAGNSSISDQDIRGFINKPGMTNEHIMNEALKQGVSIDQINQAMGGQGGFDSDNMKNYVQSRGVDFRTFGDLDPSQAKHAPLLRSVPQANFNRADFTRADFDENRGTVAGRLDSVLDPNSPLMQRAQTFANQQMNARGLLNSDMNTTAAQAAMVDAGLQIASPDAAAFNQNQLTNMTEENRNSMFNSGEANKTSMFNAGNMTDVMKTQMGIDRDMAIDSSNTLRTQMGIDSDKYRADLDAQTRLEIENKQAAQKGMTDYAALTESLMGEYQKIEDNAALDADTKALRKQELDQLVNRALSLNTFIDEVPMEWSSQSGDATQQLASRQPQTFEQKVTQENQLAKLPDGTYDPSKVYRNKNNSTLSQTEVKALNLANSLYGDQFTPDNIFTSEDIQRLAADRTKGAIEKERFMASLTPVLSSGAEPTILFNLMPE